MDSLAGIQADKSLASLSNERRLTRWSVPTGLRLGNAALKEIVTTAVLHPHVREFREQVINKTTQIIIILEKNKTKQNKTK